MTAQYLRQCKLTVSGGGTALDLSQFRVVFKTQQASGGSSLTPNSAVIRVYNLADSTVQQIQKEFTRVTLQVGYQGANLGTIFDGTIKQFGKGRENALDSYLDLMANDADVALNFATMNESRAAGLSQADQHGIISDSMGVKPAYTDGLVGGTLPRGKVLYGMSRDKMLDLSKTSKVDCIVTDTEITVFGRKKFVPDDIIVLNSSTGLISQPVQTEEGIKVLCLINPQIKIGRRIQINNKDINQTSSQANKIPFDQFPGANVPQQLLADVTDDGIYRVLVIEHQGDTRGNEWYSDLVCLSVDPSSSSVPAG